MSEPTTAAGRALLEGEFGAHSTLAGVVIEIERQARAQGALHENLATEGDIERALAAYRADLAAKVEALPMTFGQHTCWDDHEGGVDADGNPTLHADGSLCSDRMIGESVRRAAVLALIEGEPR